MGKCGAPAPMRIQRSSSPTRSPSKASSSTKECTGIFSKTNTAWGSFSYKQEEDALRVQVKPQPAEMHEALAYDFDNVTPTSATVTMRWEKVAVPFKVDVDVNDIAQASFKKQL